VLNTLLVVEIATVAAETVVGTAAAIDRRDTKDLVASRQKGIKRESESEEFSRACNHYRVSVSKVWVFRHISTFTELLTLELKLQGHAFLIPSWT
jgi:hypothetical protein